MNKNVIIIGGGIIGLSTAYYLLEEGHQVTIIDKSNFSSGASYVNAGYITPSHFIPLAAPGMINKGIKWMFNPTSPFYIKPRLNADFLKWTWAFKKSATASKVEKAIPVIKAINILSRDLYEAIKASNAFNFHYERKGLLMCYQSDKVGEAEWKIGKRGIEEGLGVKNLTKKEVDVLEPNANLNIKGAIYFDSDAHMTPTDFMPEMVKYLKTKGVIFYANEDVKDIEVTNGTVSKIITNKQELKADEVVLAAGSWSPLLTKKLGLQIPIQAGKGYRINVNRETGITIPAILCEAKVAVTPMQGFTRFAGTMEIAGINHNINPIRVQTIANAAKNYYTNLNISEVEKEAADCGLRPCSPDGLPYIGKSSKCTNLTIATGHAMMGWSLGPATGKLVSEIISEKKTTLDLSPFNPDRKF
ncbi:MULTISPECIES: NAD(P)/FAD-dependent oxidoreductase [Flavobacteriaceae]|jgi:D-amino-acid dehydrogenase|uniref:D-amino-acid dehydrogenase n=1 Tax=Cellulophaga fucicola TaxID=76595 RepID=A0A1K1MEI3_9FLAO|nr:MULTISPECIES: FAD-dependent oxidoreductase [Flavobacteriaceae]QXP53067.1 FAD-dependent oxidoreductase [Cellulophaga sp. HaHa_2_1]QXP58728.1 FAD-dependent oxidoreductase [Olleya sp. HaHaR_3_96]SFW21521.1 D-amino-acid dehydrogenase [Cellulophaga fucicola]